MILLSIAISVLFGLPSAQFSFMQIPSDQALKGVTFFGILFIIFLSCSFEEVGWRGYGIESLNFRYNLWKTSWIFGALWSLWHVPAFFIKNGYFQQEVWNLGLFHTLVYFATLFPITFLMNWVYVKNNRSILVAILCHAMMNFSVVFFQIQAIAKVVLMVLLVVIAMIVVKKNKDIYFK